MWVFPLHVCPVPKEPKKGVRTEVTDDCEPFDRSWEVNLGPLVEQAVHLICEPSLQPFELSFFNRNMHTCIQNAKEFWNMLFFHLLWQHIWRWYKCRLICIQRFQRVYLVHGVCFTAVGLWWGRNMMIAGRTRQWKGRALPTSGQPESRQWRWERGGLRA